MEDGSLCITCGACSKSQIPSDVLFEILSISLSYLSLFTGSFHLEHCAREC